MKKDKKKKSRYWLRRAPAELKVVLLTSLGLWILFLVLHALFPLKTDIQYATIVTSNDNTVIHAFLTKDDKWRMLIEPEEITPQLKKAILYKEDRYFYYHIGINPLAVCRALFNNIARGKRTSGASTITMQVARLLAPKKRTYGNKLKEMFRALQLEWRFSKSEILQLYLNLVPYGGNIEGVKAAALLYFEKAPNHLSIAELTTLSIIPNRPNSLIIGKNNERIMRERDKWLKRFQKAKIFDSQYIEDALGEPLIAQRHEAPKMAPHFSYRMSTRHPGKAIIKTYLDVEKQLKVEKIVSAYISQLYKQKIKNAAVLVINNQSRCVEAYIGSADFNNHEDAGQVDGIRAIRSPGSTLKPLLYGLAFEKGLYTPKSIISDVPVNYSGYEPENYDAKFNGNVDIEYALKNSLNVPAVKILRRLRPVTLISYLRKANFIQIQKDQKKLGLSLALGGCGVNLEELTNLYCTFANEGKYHALHWTKDDVIKDSLQLLSEASCFMLTEILTKLIRPDLPLEWYNTAHLPKVAWKTGTSYGRRDAWSIGYNKKYTIGVWVGNFSGEGVPELNGADIAAPLLFKTFNALDHDAVKTWHNTPKGVDFRLVCSESGAPPDEFCTNQVIDYYIPTISSNSRCRHLKEVWITPDSGFSYCRSCLPENGYIKTKFPNHSPEIIAFYEQSLLQYTKIPSHNPDCERIFSSGAPRITSPVDGLDYFIDRIDSTEMMLTCQAANDVEKVYWYVNDRFYSVALAGEKVFFTPAPGKIKLSCTDDKGRNTDIRVNVQYVDF